jgi:hypothetical protein
MPPSPTPIPSTYRGDSPPGDRQPGWVTGLVSTPRHDRRGAANEQRVPAAFLPSPLGSVLRGLLLEYGTLLLTWGGVAFFCSTSDAWSVPVELTRTRVATLGRAM